MRIEHFSDEHGIRVRASEEAFLVTKEQAASIREYIDELRELVRDMWQFGFGKNSGANSAREWHERAAELYDRMKELGVDA